MKDLAAGRDVAAAEDGGAADGARLGGDGVQLVYVGDNPSKDFVTPNARGWRSVQIERDQRIHHNAPVADGGAPHDLVHSLGELVSLLG